MAQNTLIFQKVSFTYEGSDHPVLRDVQLHLDRGWTGIVGSNGCGKTTLLQLALGVLAPHSGSVVRPGFPVYCAQRTDFAPDQLVDLLEAPDGYAHIDRLGIGWDWPERWAHLSHGERKRAQLAVALWQKPDLLAVDEPTNHLDQEGRLQLTQALATFRGTGVVVSHDRVLLDTLCTQIVVVEHGTAQLYRGNYSDAYKLRQQQALTQQRVYEKARKERKRLEQTIRAAKEESSRAAGRLSKRGIHHKDHDSKSKIDAARLTSKDATSARLQKRLETRAQRFSDAERHHQPQKQVDLGIGFQGSKAGRRHLVVTEEAVLPLGDTRSLHLPPLVVPANGRIGITGANGSGKSTLLRFLQHRWQAAHTLYIPQETTAAQGSELLGEIRRLSGADKGKLLQLVSRLGSDPKALLASQSPSPGETRKLLLAMGLLEQPSLIVMDEPTNHLDLPSIECLEQALASLPTALILVSHDHGFLRKLTEQHWTIQPTSPTEMTLTLDSGVADVFAGL